MNRYTVTDLVKSCQMIGCGHQEGLVDPGVVKVMRHGRDEGNHGLKWCH